MRLAIDIDSTLHPYWDQLAEVAHRRFSVDLPYETQFTWAIDKLQPDQLKACVDETHSAERVLAAEPYPGAVETIRQWHAEGHFIHITSHRAADTHPHTSKWLTNIGLPHDELYCSYDKIARCVEIGIDVLIDDAPATLTQARKAGIIAATLEHPWNRDLEDVIIASDWAGLAQRLKPFLA